MATRASPARPSAPPALPADVRLLRTGTRVVLALAGLLLLGLLALWLARQPVFNLRSIRLEGDLARNNVSTVRANALPRLVGGFFTLDLAAARAAFEAVPWVRRAEVRRLWPHTLLVRLHEHQPAALWASPDGADRMVNTQGEVFEANLGAVEDDALPTFTGPEGSAAHMLAMHRALAPLLAPLGDARVVELALSARGSWRARLDSDATLVLGRGDDAQLQARVARFVRTLPQVTSHHGRPLRHADLRHETGYAVRLSGLGTLDSAASAPPPRN